MCIYDELTRLGKGAGSWTGDVVSLISSELVDLSLLTRIRLVFLCLFCSILIHLWDSFPCRELQCMRPLPPSPPPSSLWVSRLFAREIGR